MLSARDILKDFKEMKFLEWVDGTAKEAVIVHIVGDGIGSTPKQGLFEDKCVPIINWLVLIF